MFYFLSFSGICKHFALQKGTNVRYYLAAIKVKAFFIGCTECLLKNRMQSEAMNKPQNTPIRHKPTAHKLHRGGRFNSKQPNKSTQSAFSPFTLYWKRKNAWTSFLQAVVLLHTETQLYKSINIKFLVTCCRLPEVFSLL